MARRNSVGVDGSARYLRQELDRAARPAPGFDAERYLGSPVPVLQVRTPDLRGIARAYVRSHRAEPLARTLAIADRLWSGRTFEERILAIELVTLRRKELPDSAWRRLDRWVDTAEGWGLVDSLAGGPLSELAAGRPDRYRDLREWGKSQNLWRRRASLYALNRTVRSGNLTVALPMLHRLRHDPERWVQRAVGTWLREAWKVDTPRIRAYLRREAATLPPVTLTVALERASPDERTAVRALARRRTARPTPAARR